MDSCKRPLISLRKALNCEPKQGPLGLGGSKYAGLNVFKFKTAPLEWTNTILCFILQTDIYVFYKVKSNDFKIIYIFVFEVVYTGNGLDSLIVRGPASCRRRSKQGAKKQIGCLFCLFTFHIRTNDFNFAFADGGLLQRRRRS